MGESCLVGHTPITSGRQAYAAYLGPRRQGRAFELLSHEAPKKLCKPLFDFLGGVLVAKATTGQGEDFSGR